MRIQRIFIPLLIAFFSLIIPNLHGQELIAVHPLHSRPETADIAAAFNGFALREIPRLEDGQYSVFSIDLARLPLDVPPGGFSPWICPSPSITRNAAFAITGEVEPDLENYRIRVYLWRLEDAWLLGSDEMFTTGREDCEQKMPFFLQWVLSWINREVPAEPIVIYIDGEPQIIETYIYSVDYITEPGFGPEPEPEPIEEHWLYLGLRGGIGNGNWTHYTGDNSISTHSVTSLLSVNAAFQAEFRITSFFSIQAEANFLYDFGSMNLGFGETSYSSMSFNFPLLLKLSLRGEKVSASIFGGAYYYLPLLQFSDEDWALDTYDYGHSFPGIVFGLSVSTKLGPGYIFLDTRYELDGLWGDSPDLGMIDHRNAIRFNIGYKLGFFAKNRQGSPGQETSDDVYDDL